MPTSLLQRNFQRLPALVLLAISGAGAADVSTFGGNAQHTGIYTTPAQNLNRIRWSTSIDLSNTGALTHYGAPLVTSGNTVLVPVKIAGNAFQVSAFDGSSGAAKYTLPTDYMLPAHDWIPAYSPALATNFAGARLYYPGAGGTVYYIDNPDSAPVTITRQAFYGLGYYAANAAAFNASVFIDTPITSDTNGNVFFGFRVLGTAPAPLNTGQSGFARIDAYGNASYVLAGNAAADSTIGLDSHNSAPALSNDQSTLYVAVKSSDTEFYGYLLGLDATSLVTKYKVFLRDPRNGNNAGILDDGTASPTVAPDNDVYFGVLSNPDNGSRGFLLRFSGDLATMKPPGGFGWDNTAAVVPAWMVPSYTGTSSYLIFSKYNNYANIGDGDGANKIALLDPNSTQMDPHPTAGGLIEMREVLSVTGVTPDTENPSLPNAVREWCINTAAVNPATNSIFTPSEDGHIYRWDLSTNSLSQAVTLGPGVGEPYVPTIIGPDGTIYTLNGGNLFALGSQTGVGVVLTSSVPDVRSAVAGQPMTFTVTLTNSGPSGFTPTGTVSFQDLTFQGVTPVTTTLAAYVPVGPSGQAALSTNLAAGAHLITAIYSGDNNFYSGSVTQVQVMHASVSTTIVSANPSSASAGQVITFSARVAAQTPGFGTPAGMVTFTEGNNILAQSALAGGTASFSTPALTVGSHTIAAAYYSDAVFAASSGTVTVNSSNTPIQVTTGTNPPGLAFQVDGATYTSPQTLSWTGGSAHTIATTAVQAGGSGTQYVWTNWSDAGGISHPVSPAFNASYTANFVTQYLLTMSAGTGGTYSPASGWYNSGQSVSISAAPSSGFTFSGWTGSGIGSYSGPAAQPVIALGGPVNETASFTQCAYAVAPSGQNFPAQGGSNAVSVTTGAGCTWTAISNTPWIIVTAGASGTGTGSATFTVAADNGAARSGTLTIAGQQVSIAQSGGVSTSGAAATFVKTDATTLGNWKGAYGLDGYAIANDAVSYPAYAQVSFSNQAPYTWAASTGDVRALQNATGRIASTWYNFASFDIDINLTDGKTHPVSLYVLDWDAISRAERIDVLDARTNAVLDTRNLPGFSTGQYLVWNLTGHAILRVTLTGAGNAVASGLFFGSAGSAPPSTAATFVKTDATTLGNWKGAYGLDGYAIANDAVSYPAYAQVSFSNQAPYTWAASTGDVRALQNATGRIASTWYNFASFDIDINLTDGKTHPVSLYVLDWDAISRAERIDVLDARTNAVLDTRNLPGFSTGQYLVWNLTGHAILRVTLTGAGNAVASGLFFGSAGSAPPSTAATFVKTDATTLGNWKGAYGLDGYAIANDAVSYPAYAQVSFSNQAPYTWAASTGDVRALQNATGRIASTWYNFASFDIDINLTDGKTHPVSLYVLDWDAISRAERIDVLDARTNAVLDTRNLPGFSTGQYLVWNLTGHAILRVTLTGAGNAVASGLFFGSAGSAPPSTAATFVKTDATTLGNWKGAYGLDGYAIANDAVSYPAYAQVSFSNQAPYTWAASTGDVRALQNATGRIASTWYNFASFDIDINLTDGKTHPVSLYVLDWDAISRAERIDVLDARTNAVLDTRNLPGFSTGQYLVWNLTGHAILRVTLTGAGNAVASGLFFN